MSRNTIDNATVSVPQTTSPAPISPSINPLHVALAAGTITITAALYSLSRHFITALISFSQRPLTPTSTPSLSSTDTNAIATIAPLLLAAETAAAIDETETMSTEELEALEMNLRLLITAMDAQLLELQDGLASRLPSKGIEVLDSLTEQRSHAEELYASTPSSSSSDIDDIEKQISDLQWREFQLMTADAADEDKRTYRSLLFNKRVQSHLLKQVERRLLINSSMENGSEQPLMENNFNEFAPNAITPPQHSDSAQSNKSTHDVVETIQSPSFPASPITAVHSNTIAHLAMAGFSIPHPRKSTTGGEDAFFINEASSAFGVADGVGGWANLNIDPAIYPKLLMMQCREYSSESKDPMEILQRSFQTAHAPGSCTAAVATLDGETLKLVSLGDCGVRIVRQGRVVLSTDVQEHKFNQPYQLASPEHHTANVPEDALRYEFAVQRGDIVIMGTDGLFDNIWNEEIVEVMKELTLQSPSVGHAAKTLSELAASHAADISYASPFAEEKHERTVPRLLSSAVKAYSGGKPDDITSVIALVL